MEWIYKNLSGYSKISLKRELYLGHNSLIKDAAFDEAINRMIDYYQNFDFDYIIWYRGPWIFVSEPLWP